MLTQPQGSSHYRIVGIDPGTDTLGASVLDVDLATREVLLLESNTFEGARLAQNYSNVAAVHGDRLARLIAHEDNLYGYFVYLQPHSVIAESPFLRKFPQAFAALTECISHIRRAVLRYDPFMPFLQIDPPTVKLAAGVKHKGSTKDDVKRGLQQLIANGSILNPNAIDIEALDEHSVDSIMVAYTRALFILSNL
jgi:hypothetical protein